MGMRQNGLGIVSAIHYYGSQVWQYNKIGGVNNGNVSRSSCAVLSVLKTIIMNEIGIIFGH